MEMATFKPVMAPFGTNFAEDSSTASFAVGTCGTGSEGTDWVYVVAATTIAANDVCVYSGSHSASPITTANSAGATGIGVAAAGGITSGSYGWLCRGGSGPNVKVNVLANCGADRLLFTTTTAGSLDDASVAGSELEGIVLETSAATAGAWLAQIHFPRKTEVSA
jgi:hypothetical protein